MVKSQIEEVVIYPQSVMHWTFPKVWKVAPISLRRSSIWWVKELVTDTVWPRFKQAFTRLHIERPKIASLSQVQVAILTLREKALQNGLMSGIRFSHSNRIDGKRSLMIWKHGFWAILRSQSCLNWTNKCLRKNQATLRFPISTCPLRNAQSSKDKRVRKSVLEGIDWELNVCQRTQAKLSSTTTIRLYQCLMDVLSLS